MPRATQQPIQQIYLLQPNTGQQQTFKMETLDSGRAGGTPIMQAPSKRRKTPGNLHFVEDPNDPKKWIITSDYAATAPSSQPSSHPHNPSARMTGGGDSPNMLAGEYEMGIDDTLKMETLDSGRAGGTPIMQAPSQQRKTPGNLHFVEDPNDPKRWIITSDYAARAPSSQPSSHPHNPSARMTGGGDSPNMLAGEYEMGIDDTFKMETLDSGRAGGTPITQAPSRKTRGNLHFAQDPDDPQKWIITSDSAATAPSIQPSSHPHNPSARMTGGGDSPNMMAGEYKMVIDDAPKRCVYICPNCQNSNMPRTGDGKQRLHI